MGRNGAGKTTLLNALLANSPTTPEAELRKTSGYDGPFLTTARSSGDTKRQSDISRRTIAALIEGGMTAFEWLHQWDPARLSPKNCADFSGRCCSRATKPTSRTDVLSGGEAARLLFCKLMLQKPNVLVLDEPTNHLDLESINALNIALQTLSGNGVAGHPRSRSDRRSRDAHLALRERSQDHRLQGQLRGVSSRSGRGIRWFRSGAEPGLCGLHHFRCM